MYRYNKSLLRTSLLILMLSVGPLHAQILYACAQIEKASALAIHNTSDASGHNADLCNAHQSCVNVDCDNVLNSSQGQCCEKSAELTVSPDLQENIAAINLVEVESDVDPPKPISVKLAFLPKQTFIASVESPFIKAGQSGSDTYLITHRLRI